MIRYHAKMYDTQWKDDKDESDLNQITIICMKVQQEPRLYN